MIKDGMSKEISDKWDWATEAESKNDDVMERGGKCGRK
jgi:hypothetical protein